MTTPLAYGHRNEYPPGLVEGVPEQTFYSEYPEQAGFVNNEIGQSLSTLQQCPLTLI